MNLYEAMMIKTIRKGSICFFIVTLLFTLAIACVTSTTPVSTPLNAGQTPSPTYTATTTRTPTVTTEFRSSFPTRTPMPSPTPIPTLQSGQAITLIEIKMMDEKNGWGIESGGHAVYTQDGGSTWRDVSPSDILAIYFFLDAENAWAFPLGLTGCLGTRWCVYTDSPGVIFRTTDQGRHWKPGQPLHFDSSTILPIAIHFVDAQTGWFLYINRFGMSSTVTSTLLRSDDGGITWIDLGQATDMCFPTGMSFIDRNMGWLSVDCRTVGAIELNTLEEFLSGKLSPTLYKTQNGGNDWSIEQLPPPDVYPVVYSPGTADPQGIKCGVEKIQTNAPLAIYLKWGCSLSYTTRSDFSYGYLTKLGVQPWHAWLSNVDEFILNEFYGWRLVLSGSDQPNRIEWTASGGRTWVIYHYVTWDKAKFRFINDEIGWAIVSIGDQTTLVFTTNTGDSWQELRPVIVE